MQLKDKVIIVTGGGRGIGRAFALRLAVEGASVVVADINAENADNVCKDIAASGGIAMPVHVDVSSEADTLRMADEIIKRFGKIDVLINNAAVYYGIGRKEWDEWLPEEWDRMFAVNVKGGWMCAKAVAPHMISSGKGKIINIASSTTRVGLVALLPYTCSKGAVVVLTRSLARALGKYNITVNGISPGYTDTEASTSMPGVTSSVNQRAVDIRCLHRTQHVEDLVGMAVFMSSDDADFISGQTFAVDGGESLC